MTSDRPQAQSQKSGWTLGAIKQAGLVLEGHCQGEGCRRFFNFNLDELIARAGLPTSRNTARYRLRSLRRCAAGQIGDGIARGSG